MTLHRTQLGESGSWVVFCHGLFGQGKNWTQVGKRLAERHRVLLLDMPNHGRSPWTDSFSYEGAARLVADELPDEPAAVVGHSMGGKIAMLVALNDPARVSRLAVVDISPVDYPAGREFERYIAGMRALDLSRLGRRAEADAALREAAPDDTVRGFLLQNLRRDGSGWSWQPNLDLLARSLGTLAGWPDVHGATYDGPVLWVAGARSGYVQEQYAADMERLFPRVRRVTVKGAGHWVHSEQPEVFYEVLRRFVDAAAASSPRG